MEKQPEVVRPSVRTHRHQFAWQILVPFLLMSGLIIGGAVVIISGGESQTGVWADISLIWVIAPMLLFALILLFIIGALIFGMAKLLQVTPRYTGKAQDIFSTLSQWISKAATGVTKPIAWFRQAGAVIKSFIK
jgi:hypothetical protein